MGFLLYKKVMADKELELYIHIPFCIRKCNYCDFLSFSCDEEGIEKYVSTLVEEIRCKARDYKDDVITSVFIGGGTPSILSDDQIERIMNVVKNNYNLSDCCEITIESNPGTLTEEKLLAYKNSGISRLSIGLQSANDDELKLLGRIHDYQTFVDNYNLARKLGFDNINVDLISAIPGGSIEKFKESLLKVVELNPEHISVYSLIIEEGTPFYINYGEGGPLEDTLISEDDDREIYHLTKTLLAEAGYNQYEISNYSKVGKECQHNIGYWIRKNYIGFGLGASSLYDNVRYKNTLDMNEYLISKTEKVSCGYMIRKEVENLVDNEIISEYLYLGLRMNKGVNLKEVSKYVGQDVYEIFKKWIEMCVQDGLLLNNDNIIRLTDKGQDLANYVMAGFV